MHLPHDRIRIAWPTRVTAGGMTTSVIVPGGELAWRRVVRAGGRDRLGGARVGDRPGGVGRLHRHGGTPVDARSYYAVDLADPYWKTSFAFFYSPAAAQATAPFQALPFGEYVAILRALELRCDRRLGRAVLPARHLLVAAGVRDQRGQRQHAGRRRGRLGAAVARLVGVRPPDEGDAGHRHGLVRRSAGVAAPGDRVGRHARRSRVSRSSVVPDLWFQWIAYLTTVPPSDGYRSGSASGRRASWSVGRPDGRRWTVVFAATIAMPRLYLMTPAMLVVTDDVRPHWSFRTDRRPGRVAPPRGWRVE